MSNQPLRNLSVTSGPQRYYTEQCCYETTMRKPQDYLRQKLQQQSVSNRLESFCILKIAVWEMCAVIAVFFVREISASPKANVWHKSSFVLDVWFWVHEWESELTLNKVCSVAVRAIFCLSSMYSQTDKEGSGTSICLLFRLYWYIATFFFSQLNYLLRWSLGA